MSTRAINAGRSRVFGIAAIAIVMLVFAGFAPSYYLRAWLQARVITPLVHVHGLAMSACVALFTAQIWLVAHGRVSLHRRLGLAGVLLAPAIIVIGTLTVARAIWRRFPEATPARFWRLFVEFDGLSLYVFGALVLCAIVWRRRGDVHKRLMLAATASVLPPAVGRIVEHFVHDNGAAIAVAVTTSAFIVLCACIDTVKAHRPHPAMFWGTASVIAANGITCLLQVLD